MSLAAAGDALWQLDAVDTAALVRSGRISAREATEAHLRRIDAVNPKLNAVVHRCHEQALADADAADRAQRAGAALGPLHGVPVTVKITADQKGYPADNGITLFKDLIAAEDAPVVRNLREAGAIVVGRTNSPAFAMRFLTDNVLHGQTWNPWDRDVTCGGSSGGAGAATAAGMGTFAHGTDIGGSIRWPAYCNGIVGLRTTPGRIPMYNRTASAPSRLAAQLMAVPGPMTRSVRDARLGFEVMAGRGDPVDPLWQPVPLRGPAPAAPLRVALVVGDTGTEVHPSAIAAVRQAGRWLEAAGCVVEEVTPPGYVRAYELWEAIGLHEIRAALEPMLPAVGDARLSAALTGWWNSAPPLDLARYWAALGERHTLMRQWSQFMAERPIVITPVCAQPRVRPDLDGTPAGMQQLLDQAGRFLFQSPVLGFPVLAMPIGEHEGQPQGVQICAPRWREDLCLQVGELIEAHQGPRRPIDPRW